MYWRGHPYFFPFFSRQHFHSRGCPPVPTLPGHFVFTAAVPLLPHFAATARISLSVSCLCFLPFPCPSPSFCTASTSVALVMFPLSFAVCTHQHPSFIPHSPHLVHHFLPDGCLNWSIGDMAFSTSSTGKETTCFCTHKFFLTFLYT